MIVKSILPIEVTVGGLYYLETSMDYYLEGSLDNILPPREERNS